MPTRSSRLRMPSRLGVANAALVGAVAVVSACSVAVDFGRYVAAENRDAGDASDGAPDGAPFCASLSPKPAVCADFDVEPVFTGWADHFQPPGEGGVDDASARSAPNSLIGMTPSCIEGCPAGTAFLYREVSGVHFREWTYSFDLQVDTKSTGTQNGPLAASVDYNANDTSYSMQLWLSPSDTMVLEKAYLADGGVDLRPHVFDFRAIGLRTWRRMEIVVKPDAGNYVLALKIDGEPVPFQDDGRSIIGPYVERTPGIGIGMIAVPLPADDWTMRVDNLVFDGK